MFVIQWEVLGRIDFTIKAVECTNPLTLEWSDPVVQDQRRIAQPRPENGGGGGGGGVGFFSFFFFYI